MMQKEVEKTVSWYAYGVGLVKESTYGKKGNWFPLLVAAEGFTDSVDKI